MVVARLLTVHRTVVARLLIAGLALTALCAGAAPSPAHAASPYQQVLAAYEHTGAIAPCTFSSPDLNAALKGVDTYGAQYFADFTQAVNDALAARAAGACSPSVRSRRGSPPRAGSGGGSSGRSGPGVGIPAHMMALTGATGGAPPAPLLLLGGLLVGGAVAAGIVLIARVRSPH